jgi:hypothetical protein
MRVTIIIPYFGNWPAWMDFFLLSCEMNPDFNWMIFSDNQDQPEVPSNVVIKSFSLGEFNRLASSRLGLDIHIRNPYKICDLRPAFGTIFRDFLMGTDYWGYSDLDLVYGNLSGFLGSKILKDHDIITSRKEYIAGHFTLYRNVNKVNELYKICPQHRDIFQDHSRHFAFDERSNLYGRSLFNSDLKNNLQSSVARLEYIWHKFKKKLQLGIPVGPLDISSIINLEEEAGRLRVYRKNMVRSDKWYEKQNLRNWKVDWENGRLFDASSKKDLLYFHFLKSKYRDGFRISPAVRNGWHPGRRSDEAHSGVSSEGMYSEGNSDNLRAGTVDYFSITAEGINPA